LAGSHKPGDDSGGFYRLCWYYAWDHRLVVSSSWDVMESVRKRDEDRRSWIADFYGADRPASVCNSNGGFNMTQAAAGW